MAGGSYEFKQKLNKFFKFIFAYGYYATTAFVPVYVFYRMFKKENSIILAFAVAFISLIVMDIICTLIEDFSEVIYKGIKRIGEAINSIKQKKEDKKEELKRQKEEEFKKLEELISAKKSYKDDIEKASERKENFIKSIKKNKELLPKEVRKALEKVYEKMDDIIKILENDEEEYYPIRHAFTIYLPEFERITNRLINIAEGDSLDDQAVTDYMKLTNEFDQYLDYIKSRINSTDKMSLNIEITSFVKVMEAERKKGEENAGK